MSESETHDHEDHGGLGTYLAVFGGLCVLTAMSYWIGNSNIKETMPSSAWAGMMAVSCGKAMLVILFFMHLKWEASWKYVLTIPAGMMSVFLVLMLVPDVGRRTIKYSEERWLYAAEPAVHAASEPNSHDHDDGSDPHVNSPGTGEHG